MPTGGSLGLSFPAGGSPDRFLVLRAGPGRGGVGGVQVAEEAPGLCLLAIGGRSRPWALGLTDTQYQSS